MHIYYTNQNNAHTLHIDEGSRTTTIRLPKEIDEQQAASFAKSDVAQYVISALLKEGEA